MLYFATTTTAYQFHQASRQVTCERCGQKFGYAFTRRGVGSSYSPYGLGSKSGEVHAERTAAQQAAERTHTEAELVPCPGCGWVNEDAIRQFRAGQYRGLLTYGLLLSIVSLAVAGVMVFLTTNGAIQNGRDIEFTRTLAAWVGGVGLATAVFLIALRTWRLSRIQPNRAFPHESHVPPGTPAALVKTDDGGFEFVPDPIPRRIRPDKLAFRLGWDALPPECCVCMADDPDSQLPVEQSFGQLNAAACARCASSVVTRLRLANAVSLLAAAAVLAGGTWWLTESVTAVVFAVGVGLLVWFLATASWIHRRLAPISLIGHSIDRGVLLLSMKNPDYRQRYRQINAGANDLAPSGP